MSASPFIAHLSLESSVGAELTQTRIRLLEAIAATGSISQAAKRVPLSYKAAWDAVDQINNLSAQPLVARSTGGSGGGGTRLTDYGQRVVAFYRALEQHYQTTLDQVAAGLDEASRTEVADFRQLLLNLNWRSSARNQFSGAVTALEHSDVESIVTLGLDDATELTALVTRESAEQLRLAPGRALVALVKASAVLIGTDPGLRLSAQNLLWGTVERVHEGPVNHEVVLALPAGRRVTATLTAGSSRQLGLAPGLAACACFSAASVLLMSAS